MYVHSFTCHLRPAHMVLVKVQEHICSSCGYPQNPKTMDSRCMINTGNTVCDCVQRRLLQSQCAQRMVNNNARNVGCLQLSKMMEESESKKQTQAEVQLLQHTVDDLTNQVAGLQEDLSIAQASSSTLQQELEATRCKTVTCFQDDEIACTSITPQTC